MSWQATRLWQAGILGLNRRNLDYIQRYNQRRLYPLVDDKLRTRELAEKAGINVPPTYAVIESEHQNRTLARKLQNHEQFVIKPAQGSGGNGILIIQESFGTSHRRNFLRGSGRPLDTGDLRFHVSNILSGLYSLGGNNDRAIVEYRIPPHPLFDNISYRGIPDIRTVVFRGVPVMAMLRLATSRSGGKANLHQGAIGAGINMRTGRTREGVWFERPVSRHPDTGEAVPGLELPDWQGLMLLAARCHDLTGLGYLGVDVVLDPQRGPMLLELNARPGLSIQLANRMGLLPRLRKIERMQTIPETPEERVALGRELTDEGEKTAPA